MSVSIALHAVSVLLLGRGCCLHRRYIIDSLTFAIWKFRAFCFFLLTLRKPSTRAARVEHYSLVPDTVSISPLDDDVEILAPPSITVRPPSVISIPPPATVMPLKEERQKVTGNRNDSV